MSNFSGEFAAHPDCQELFVVNGMPFLSRFDAENFQRGTDHKLTVVKRPATAAPADEIDPAKMNKAQVVAALEAKGIPFDPKAKKADLVALLTAAPEEE